MTVNKRPRRRCDNWLRTAILFAFIPMACGDTPSELGGFDQRSTPYGADAGPTTDSGPFDQGAGSTDTVAPVGDLTPTVQPDAYFDSGGAVGGLNCRDPKTWPAEWTEFEAEVLKLTNQRRVSGHNCDGEWYPAVPALTYDPKLTEAARCHSVDMGENDFMGHTGKGNTSAGDRIETAGYVWWGWGENVAAGYKSPTAVVQGWMDSPGHCVNIMKASFEELGVGFVFWKTGKYSERWTQNFGRPQ
jgi:uncharacterized protein YkwD